MTDTFILSEKVQVIRTRVTLTLLYLLHFFVNLNYSTAKPKKFYDSNRIPSSIPETQIRSSGIKTCSREHASQCLPAEGGFPWAFQASRPWATVFAKTI